MPGLVVALVVVVFVLAVVLIVFVVLLVRHFNSPLKNCISTKSLRDDVHIFCAGMR